MEPVFARWCIAVAVTLCATMAAGEASAQSAKDRILGAWTMTFADSVRPDGTRTPAFGADPRGIMIFSPDGSFALIQMRTNLPGIAAKSRDLGTAEENKAIVSGSIAYYGTYSVNEAEGTLTLRPTASTFANVVAAGEQRRVISRLTPDEFTFTNPNTPSGAVLEVGWRRSK